MRGHLLDERFIFYLEHSLISGVLVMLAGNIYRTLAEYL